MADYSLDSLLEIYDEMELDLIKARKKHITAMALSGVKKSEIKAWEEAQKRELAKFKRESRKIISDYRKIIKGKSTETLTDIYIKSKKRELTRMIRNYGKNPRFKQKLSEIGTDAIWGFNEQRMVALLNAVNNDTDKALSSIYRQANDEYRQTIHNAAVRYNTGTETLAQCIDIAQNDFLTKGIAYITYKNGAKYNIRDYAEMALRTNSQRAIMEGEAMIRGMLDIKTVRISRHGITCPKCAPWQGRVLFDDEHNDPKDNVGHYPLLSTAREQGLFHPNCRHTPMTIVPEIDGGDVPYTYTASDLERYEAEQTQRRYERKIRETKRKIAGSTSTTDIEKYKKQLKAEQKSLRDYLKGHDYLPRRYDREQI